jgi:hypothetical protein
MKNRCMTRGTVCRHPIVHFFEKLESHTLSHKKYTGISKEKKKERENRSVHFFEKLESHSLSHEIYGF